METTKKEFGITKGEWMPHHVEHLPTGFKSKVSMIDIVADVYGTTREQANANAQLIADAGTTANITGKLPSQLAEENKMLLKVLKNISSAFDPYAINYGLSTITFEDVEQAIAKAEGRAV